MIDSEKQGSLAIGVLPNDWKEVNVCGLSLSVPPDFKEKKLKPIDSCIADFENNDMSLGLDVYPVGIEAQSFTRRDLYANEQDFIVYSITLDERKAEITNCTLTDTSNLETNFRFVTVLDVPDEGLTIAIYSRDAERQKAANQIAGSLRFDD